MVPPIISEGRERGSLKQAGYLSSLYHWVWREAASMNKIQSNWGSPWVSALFPYTQVHIHACMYPHTYLNLHTYAYTSTVPMQKEKRKSYCWQKFSINYWQSGVWSFKTNTQNVSIETSLTTNTAQRLHMEQNTLVSKLLVLLTHVWVKCDK